jgi:hypothetical protein
MHRFSCMVCFFRFYFLLGMLLLFFPCATTITTIRYEEWRMLEAVVVI